MKDDDFPEDDNEHWYWWRVDQTVEMAHITEEIDEVSCESQLDRDHALEVGHLLSMPPVVPGMTKDQSLSFFAAVDDWKHTGSESDTPKDKKIKKDKKDEEAKVVMPDPPLKLAEKLGDKLLKYSSNAHKFKVGLVGVDVSDGMASWMDTAEETAQTLYKTLQNKTRAKMNTEADYTELTDQSNILFDVYDQYAPLANQMLNRLKAKKEKVVLPEGEAGKEFAKKKRRVS